jgi:biopolymer transport protein ExbD
MIKFIKKHRQEPVEPQLATMIDVFSILIIFLVAGSSFDQLSVNLPNQFVIPSLFSASAQSTSAQMVVLHQLEMQFQGLQSQPKIPISVERDQELELKNASYILGLIPEEYKKQNNYFNQISLIASKEVKYDELFSAIAQLRKIGFKNINLIGTMATQ